MLLHTFSDQQLVSTYLEGNVSALETLVKRHKDRIYSFIISKVRNQALADDIFQDAFFKVIKSYKKENIMKKEVFTMGYAYRT